MSSLNVDTQPTNVTAEIPLSELFGYTTSLRGMSQGRAFYRCGTFSSLSLATMSSALVAGFTALSMAAILPSLSM